VKIEQTADALVELMLRERALVKAGAIAVLTAMMDSPSLSQKHRDDIKQEVPMEAEPTGRALRFTSPDGVKFNAKVVEPLPDGEPTGRMLCFKSPDGVEFKARVVPSLPDEADYLR